MSGRRAAQPPPGLQAFDADTTGEHPSAVTLVLEDASAYLFDLSAYPGTRALHRGLGEGVRSWTASADGGRRIASVKAKQRAVAAFLRWLDESAADNPKACVEAVSQITPFHLRQYREDLLAGRNPSTADEYFAGIRMVLRFAPGTTDATSREANRRQGWTKPRTRIERYSHRDFARIRHAARRKVENAHARISAAYREAVAHTEGNGPATVRGQALYEVMTRGKPQGRAGFRALGALTACGYGNLNNARRHLFLDADEVLAAAVLMACHRGLNLSPIVTSGTPAYIDEDMVQLDLDKPRRGPAHRFWPEIISDSEDLEQGAAEAVRMIAEATEPARVWLAHNGQPSSRLLIRWSHSSNRPMFGIGEGAHAGGAGSRTGGGGSWVPEGIRIEFPRLRRSVPNQGVAKEPTDHDPAVYLHYVRTDPIALAEEQAEASKGIQAAMDRARLEVHDRMRGQRDSGPDRDALVANCRDPEHKPATGLLCTTGFFSFLDCLDCDNAAMVSRLLPRQLAALSVLEELRDALNEAWERKFARRYYMLRAVTERYSAAELEAASELMETHRPAIIAALRQESPE